MMANWWATEDYRNGYYGPPLRLDETARRFDISPAWFSWVGGATALETLLDIGIDEIYVTTSGSPTASARPRWGSIPRTARSCRRGSGGGRAAGGCGVQRPCGRERPALVPCLQHGR